VPVPPLPDLAPARQLGSAHPETRGFIQAHLMRGQNRVIWTLREAARVANAEISAGILTGEVGR